MARSEAIEPWRRRLFLPNYQLREAARYAQIGADTVADWHKVGRRKTLSTREGKAALSYMQLIEVAVVAAFRKAGLGLKNIRETREYVAKQFSSEFPFAEYRFKADGKRLVMDFQEIEGEKGKGKILRPDQGGQLAWEAIIGRLSEFDYEHKGIVIKWHVAGPKSPIVIDPRVAYGAPTIKGTPTWAISGRWDAGEPVSSIADDFGLTEQEVREALIFEGVSGDGSRWTH
jgi:uncharacterized protein (DUF433 family)